MKDLTNVTIQERFNNENNFDYFINYLASKFNFDYAVTFESIEDDYYNIMEDNNINDDDIYDMSKSEIQELVNKYMESL